MQSDEEIIEMLNGCVCCTVRQDLVVVLKKLAKRCDEGLKLDGIVIETTGMADPAPVAQTFFVDAEVKAFAKLDGIVTLVDAKHIEQHLDEEKPEGAENEAVEQVAFADRMILNKCDLVNESDLARVEGRLKAINAFAPIVRSTQSQVNVGQVLDIRGFDLKRTLDMDPEFLNTDGEHEHDESVTSISITQPGEVHMLLVNEWVGMILKDKGEDIYRMKGVLAIAGSKKKFVYQAVHMIFDGEFDGAWAEGEARENKLVFIGKNLDHAGLKQGFADCLENGANAEKIRAVERVKVMERQHQGLLGASQRDDVRALTGIVASGADVSYANTLGQTALHIASMWGNYKACEFLVKAGGNVAAKNQLGGNTPLHMVAASTKGSPSGRIECAKVLVAGGADLKIMNDEGAMPWQLAENADIRAALTPP